MRRLSTIDKEIRELETKLGPLKSQLGRLRSERIDTWYARVGPIRLCRCGGGIYKDGKFWRGEISHNACCIDGTYHTPDYAREVYAYKAQHSCNTQQACEALKVPKKLWPCAGYYPTLATPLVSQDCEPNRGPQCVIGPGGPRD